MPDESLVGFQGRELQERIDDPEAFGDTEPRLPEGWKLRDGKLKVPPAYVVTDLLDESAGADGRRYEVDNDEFDQWWNRHEEGAPFMVQINGLWEGSADVVRSVDEKPRTTGADRRPVLRGDPGWEAEPGRKPARAGGDPGVPPQQQAPAASQEQPTQRNREQHHTR